MSPSSLSAALALASALTLGTALPAFAITAIAATGVNVRECGSTDCDIVDVLDEGERVDVRYCEGIWCAIDHPGPDGFVHARYLLADEDDFDDDDFVDFDRFEDDDAFDGRIYVERRTYPRRFIRRFDPFFGACIGGPNARLCVFD